MGASYLLHYETILNMKLAVNNFLKCPDILIIRFLNKNEKILQEQRLQTTDNEGGKHMKNWLCEYMYHCKCIDIISGRYCHDNKESGKYCCLDRKIGITGWTLCALVAGLYLTVFSFLSFRHLIGLGL